MPTVILLDVSLSMCKIVPMAETTESYSIKSLAVHGLTTFLDQLTRLCKLEFASLMLFSSLWELNVNFTRDYESIKAALIALDNYFDKTNIFNGLRGVQEVVLEEWGSCIPTQIILVTDGYAGISSLLMKNGNLVNDDPDLKQWSLPFPFPCKLHIVCINSPTEPGLRSSLSFYENLIDLSNSQSSTNRTGNQLWTPEGEKITLKSIENLFIKLAESSYSLYKGKLHFGSLSCSVSVYPAIESYTDVVDFGHVSAEPSKDIHVCGFLDIAEIASPPVHSRHLMFALPMSKEEVCQTPSILTINKDIESASSTAEIEETLNAMCNEEGKQPSLCVILHGSLKVEGMVAVCKLGEPHWYGILNSWADSKKKSNLMLSTFHCGSETVSWLGNINLLGLPSLSLRLPPMETNKYGEKKSYAQNCVVWIKQSGLQADVQKVMRLAKKLPEKTANFYKELNRFRKAALAFGFYEIIEGLATVLERECTMLPGTAHPDAHLELTHAVTMIRASKDIESYSSPIYPLKTKLNDC